MVRVNISCGSQRIRSFRRITGIENRVPTGVKTQTNASVNNYALMGSAISGSMKAKKFLFFLRTKKLYSVCCMPLYLLRNTVSLCNLSPGDLDSWIGKAMSTMTWKRHSLKLLKTKMIHHQLSTMNTIRNVMPLTRFSFHPLAYKNFFRLVACNILPIVFCYWCASWAVTVTSVTTADAEAVRATHKKEADFLKPE